MECRLGSKMMNKILILANYDVGLYKFRKELIEKLLIEKYEVYISLPNGEYIDDLKRMGCHFIETRVDRRGTNIFSDTKLLLFYKKIMKEINPDVVLTYTIKPNIYGGIVAKQLKIPYIANVTGLGTALENEGPLKNILIKLYKYSLSSAKKVFFQNEKNMSFFDTYNIISDRRDLLPGSGVNTDEFRLLDYPDAKKINFVFISRVMKDKGINEYLEAAKYIKNNYENVNFHICGFTEEDYEETLTELHNNGTIIYHGMIDNVQDMLEDMHCIIHPSYHEGMSNVLLEAASSGRPIIASDIPGCRETFEDGITGFSFPKQDTEGLIQTIEKFIQLDNNTRKQMGLSGRKKMEKEFDRQIVVEKYLKEIESI